ncbi:homogentisate phytyltransferase [Pannus brasiliensis CCIBt3594]|uniref:Homogentisate phytyltransferase n=1 Tax=Pannus brasiliensis CCIBt3594 TaxID=1427578 RepID=A0AAW9QVJ3_9CHRO
MSQFASTVPFSRLQSLWKFSRPHTIIGTSLSVLALYILSVAGIENFPLSRYVWQALLAWIACLCGNIYIVGLNQLEDIAIDKINKPDLPLASGRFSVNTGRAIVLVTGILACILSLFGGLWLFGTVSLSLAIGTAYSLPPVRLKRFPLPAALCILTVRGVVVNLGLFLHFRTVMGENGAITPPVWLLTLFILLFTIAIAIFKDVPDTEGDRTYRITTFTLLLGKSKILRIVLLTISLCYALMIGAGLARLPGMNPPVLVVGHLALLLLLWWRARGVNLEETTEITDFYQFIWKLFFLEYILFPLACLP